MYISYLQLHTTTYKLLKDPRHACWNYANTHFGFHFAYFSFITSHWHIFFSCLDFTLRIKVLMYTSSSRVQELIRHFENHFEIIDSTYKEIEILTYLLRYTLVTDQIPEIAISRTNYTPKRNMPKNWFKVN